MQHVPPFLPSLHFLWSLSSSCPCVLRASLLISTVATLACITAFPFTLTKAPCLSARPTHEEPCPGKKGGALGSSESYSLMNTGSLRLCSEEREQRDRNSLRASLMLSKGPVVEQSSSVKAARYEWNGVDSMMRLSCPLWDFAAQREAQHNACVGCFKCQPAYTKAKTCFFEIRQRQPIFE